MEDATKTEDTTELEDTTQPEDATKIEDKNTKKKRIVIAAVIAAAVVVAAGAAILPRKNSKDIVIDAFKGIVAEGQTDPMEEIFGWKEMYQTMNKESSQVGMELQIQDSSNETVKQLTTAKLGITAYNDVPGKKMSFVMGVGYADMNLANLEFFLDNQQLVMALPELSTKAVSLNYADDLEGQIEKSPYLGPLLNEKNVDFTGVNTYLTQCNEMASSGNQLFDIEELWKRYKKGSKAIDDLKTAMTVEKGEKKKFVINGKNQNCKGYQVTIPKDALIQFATVSKDFFLSDETMKKDFVEYMSLVTELQGFMNSMTPDMAGKTPEQLQQENWKNAEEEFDSVISHMKESMGDVTMVVYVGKKDTMASFDYNTTIKSKGEDVKVGGTVSFAGGYNRMANVNATLNMEDTASQVITMTAEKTGIYEPGKTYAGTLTASVTNGTDVYGISADGNYGVADGTYMVGANFKYNGTDLGKLTSDGLVQNLVKGESFELVMDSLKMETPMLTGTNEYIDVSGSYKAEPLTMAVEIPAGETFDIMAATEENWNGFFTEISGNAYKLMLKLFQ
ncbi:MAG: zinc ribbon domain-containing protein [Clostridium sp.]